ncbi:MAG: hypothetical protein M1830_000110 [Pleopsidium flavum]|nr:MAG: hypothetical protein M1830_000110 [Pleopsidium flavum]
MAVNHQVAITLTAVNYPDDFRQRVITLTPALRVLNIGRSSKSETKNLVAAEDNAWFDSPVMSREHARLWISTPDSRFVYLKDVGSMHGTSIQDRSLVKNIDHILKDGEIITFGIEVTRGQETFPARQFRVNYEWQEWSPPTPKSNSPAQSSPMRHVVSDRTPAILSEPLQEPSVRFRVPSSQGFSVPESDSSDASVAEEDGSDEDGFEPLSRAAEVPSAPANLGFEGPTGLTEEDEDADEDAYSTVDPTNQVEPMCSAKLGAGNSQHNPIDLDDGICARSQIIGESDEEGPEVVPNPKISSSLPMNLGRHVLPYGYILKAPIADNHSEGLGSDMDQDSDQSDVVEDSDIEVAGIFAAEDPEHTNQGDRNQVVETQANHGERSITERPLWGSDRVYKSTYDEPDDDDEDEDDVSSSVNETEDEGFASSEAAFPNYGDKAEAQRSLESPKTSQSKPHPTLLVEDSQSQIHGAPRISTGAVLDVSYQLQADASLAPGRRSLPEREPSPSDAALAKTSAVKESQSFHNINKRYCYGESALSGIQNYYNNSKPPATSQTASGDASVSHPTRHDPFIDIKPSGPVQVNYGTSHRYGKAWDISDTNQTHYSDGPFKLDAPPMPPPMVPAGRLPALVGQDTSLNVRSSGHSATYGDYEESPATKIYDRFLDEEQYAHDRFSSLCDESGHQWLQGRPHDPFNSYVHIQTDRPGNIIPYTPLSSRCKAEEHESPFPVVAKAASKLSIDAIVEKSSSQSSAQIIGTKRKADEISSATEDLTCSPSLSQSSNTGIDVDNTNLPDAQPREVSDLTDQANLSQSTETSSKQRLSVASMAAQEVRPKKRAKTIAKWIGTTVMVGVGAFVALTATAPQSVWDEVEREMGL